MNGIYLENRFCLTSLPTDIELAWHDGAFKRGTCTVLNKSRTQNLSSVHPPEEDVE